jgi:ferritin-like metal-binding protein YciE
MPAGTLRELFVNELRDIYDAEKQLTRAIPKMAKAAQSDELKAAFGEHLEVTRRQVTRLEDVFRIAGVAARGKTCEGMKGLIEEADHAIEEMEGSVLDAALIGSAQKVEHYEIATYGTLATFAEVLEMEDAKDLLGQTLEEEKEADEKLTAIATQVNPEAEMGEGEEEDEGEMAASAPRSSRSTSTARRGSNGRTRGSRGKKR